MQTRFAMRMRRVYREGMPESTDTPPIYTARVHGLRATVELTVTATDTVTVRTAGASPDDLARLADGARALIAARVADASPAPVRIVEHPGETERVPLITVERDLLERVSAYLEHGRVAPALGLVQSVLAAPREVPPLTIEGLS